MRKQAFIISLFTLLSLASFAQVRHAVTFNQLPPSAQSFLRNNLSTMAIRQMTKIVDGPQTTFEVKLVNSTLVIFNRDGGWKSITTAKSLPESAIPGEVWQHLKEDFRNQPITSITKQRSSYTVVVDGNTITLNNLEQVNK